MQLRRLPEFIEARKKNWLALRRRLAPHEDLLEFALPTHATGWHAIMVSAGMTAVAALIALGLDSRLL